MSKARVNYIRNDNEKTQQARQKSRRWNRAPVQKTKGQKRLEAVATFTIAVLVATALLLAWETLGAMLKTGLFALTNGGMENYVSKYFKDLRVVHLFLQGIVITTVVFWFCSTEGDFGKQCAEKIPVGFRGIIFVLSTGAILELTNILAFLIEFCASAIVAGVTSVLPIVEVTNIIRISLLVEQFDPPMRLLEGFALLSLRGMFKNYMKQGG